MTIIPIESREHWLSLRSRNVGASEVAALWGCQPDYAMSHYTLWQVLAGRMDRPQVDGERVRWGVRNEPAVAVGLYEDHGIGPAERCGYAQHPTIRGFGATPDFILPDGRLLECKTVDWKIHKDTWGGEPPMHILLQSQAQLACVPDAPGVVVAALVGGNELRFWEYGRRPRLIADIERRVTDFWRSIDEGREPPIDGSVSTLAAVKDTYRSGGDNSAIELDNLDFADLCAQHQDAKAAIKAHTEMARECEAKLLKMLSGAQRGYGLGWRASIIERKATPERVITEDMVGQTLPGRKGSISLQVREVVNG